MGDKEIARMYKYLDIIQKLTKKAMESKSIYINSIVLREDKEPMQQWYMKIYISKRIGGDDFVLWLYNFSDDEENMAVISEAEKYIEEQLKIERNEN